jgi:DNA-binding response OmpR family regulator
VEDKKDISKKPKILIVEDDVVNNQMIKDILEVENYSIFQLYRGEDVLDILENGENEYPDLILLDLMLPDISGFEVCRKLKMSRKTNPIPILMITALNDFKSMINGIMVGANQYISKPFSTDELLNEVKELLEWRRELIRNGEHFEQITFAMNSEIKYLDQLNNMIANILRRTRIDEEDIEEIKSGIYEMCVNAIEWGNKFNKELIVKVNYEISEKYLKIKVEDEGSGFNFRKFLNGEYKGIEHQEERIDEGKRLGGFGISMARLYFDEVKYNETGNIVQLIKKLK